MAAAAPSLPGVARIRHVSACNWRREIQATIGKGGTSYDPFTVDTNNEHQVSPGNEPGYKNLLQPVVKTSRQRRCQLRAWSSKTEAIRLSRLWPRFVRWLDIEKLWKITWREGMKGKHHWIYGPHGFSTKIQRLPASMGHHWCYPWPPPLPPDTIRTGDVWKEHVRKGRKNDEYI